MEPESTISNGNKGKLYIIIFGLITVLLSGVILLVERINLNKEEILPKVESVPLKQTESDILLESQNRELDKLRARYQEYGTPLSATTTQKQIENIDTIRNQKLRQKTSASVSVPVKTIKQQSQELDALRANAN